MNVIDVPTKPRNFAVDEVRLKLFYNVKKFEFLLTHSLHVVIKLYIVLILLSKSCSAGEV